MCDLILISSWLKLPFGQHAGYIVAAMLRLEGLARAPRYALCLSFVNAINSLLTTYSTWMYMAC
jgi:hypothetical protein